jgi:hypothetical protein
MIYKYAGGVWLILMGVEQCGILNIPGIIIGILGILAGVALIMGR